MDTDHSVAMASMVTGHIHCCKCTLRTRENSLICIRQVPRLGILSDHLTVPNCDPIICPVPLWYFQGRQNPSKASGPPCDLPKLTLSPQTILPCSSANTALPLVLHTSMFLTPRSICTWWSFCPFACSPRIDPLTLLPQRSLLWSHFLPDQVRVLEQRIFSLKHCLHL